MSKLEISDFRFYITCFVKDFPSKTRMSRIKPLIRLEYIDWILKEIGEEESRQKYLDEKEDLQVHVTSKNSEYFDEYKKKRQEVINEFDRRLWEHGMEVELSVIPLAPFPYNEYNYIVAVEIRLGSIDTSGDPKPYEIFKQSRQVKQVMNEINEGENAILCDNLNLHPYALVVASSVDGGTGMKWDRNTISENKRMLGSWIEYYSGQWEDYSEELYDSRVEGNLSNRTSELHYIRSNSAFIYMEQRDPRWKDFLYGYMQTYFVEQVLLARAILYCLMVVNGELDRVSERLRGMPSGAIKLIEKEISFVEDLNLAVSEISSTLNRERLMNRLAHSTKVVKRCFEVFSLEEAAEVVSSKVADIKESANTEYQKEAEKIQKQQERWVLVLNALIGSQILFIIKDQLSSVPYLGQNTAFVNFFDQFIWVAFMVLLTISVGGLAYGYVKSRTTWLTKKGEES